MDLLVFFFWVIIFGGITALIARAKGRNQFVWFLFGCGLFIVALPVILLLPAPAGNRHSPRKICPYCGAMLAGGQMNCPQCKRTQPDIGAATESSWQRTVAADDEVTKWAKQKEVLVPKLKTPPPPPVEINFICPKCNREMSGPEAIQFNEVDCPACGEKFTPAPKDAEK